MLKDTAGRSRHMGSGQCGGGGGVHECRRCRDRCRVFVLNVGAVVCSHALLPVVVLIFGSNKSINSDRGKVWS